MEDGDGELIARSLQGDVDAFADLARRHGQAIHGYLSRRSSRAVADDLLGEVWVRSFRARRTYDRSWVSARPWLYGIARNVLREHWRKERVGWGLLDAPQSPWDAVDDRLDARAQRTALLEAVKELKIADREILLLVAWEGLSPSEAAVALGITAGTARWRLHRARRSFRDLFDAKRDAIDSEATSSRRNVQ
jgi:RNA polymerase sigma factor (sigma-70 family)